MFLYCIHFSHQKTHWSSYICNCTLYISQYTTHSPIFFLSLSLSLCLSVRLSVCLCIYCNHLSTYGSIYVHLYLCLYLYHSKCLYHIYLHASRFVLVTRLRRRRWRNGWVCSWKNWRGARRAVGWFARAALLLLLFLLHSCSGLLVIVFFVFPFAFPYRC